MKVIKLEEWSVKYTLSIVSKHSKHDKKWWHNTKKSIKIPVIKILNRMADE